MHINTFKSTVQFKQINDTTFKNELKNNIASQKFNSHVTLYIHVLDQTDFIYTCVRPNSL